MSGIAGLIWDAVADRPETEWRNLAGSQVFWLGVYPDRGTRGWQAHFH